MAQRKTGLGELAEKVDITQAKLSVLKNSKAKAIRFSTLDALCRELKCKPGDILDWAPDQEGELHRKRRTDCLYFPSPVAVLLAAFPVAVIALLKCRGPGL